MYALALDHDDPSAPPPSSPLPIPGPHDRSDTKLSPCGTYLAFVSDGDLWVQAREPGAAPHAFEAHAIRLTNSHLEDPDTMTGVAEFVMQEEFHRTTGYWWSPPAVAPTATPTILAIRVDESHVQTCHIASSAASREGAVTPQRYPLAGLENARFAVDLIDVAACTVYTLRTPIQTAYPWVEYLVDAGFAEDDRHVWFYVMDRAQQQAAVLLCDRSPRDHGGGVWVRRAREIAPGDGTTPAQPVAPIVPPFTPLVMEISPRHLHINRSRAIHFLPPEATGSAALLISSEVLGPEAEGRLLFRRLYRVTYDPADPQSHGLPTPLTCATIGVDNAPLALTATTAAFTMGHPTVLDRSLGLLSVVTANAEHASSDGLSRDVGGQAAATPPDKPSYIMQLVIAASMIALVDAATPPTLRVLALTAASNGGVPREVARLPLPVPTIAQLPTALLTHYTFTNAHGDLCRGCYYRPATVRCPARLPTIVSVYGGPGVQQISHAHAAGEGRLLAHIWALAGYLVVLVDGVGSARRGLAFEGRTQGQLGALEVQDQLDGLRDLVASGLADPARVAIIGWSYGGYVALMALAQRPDAFKIAIAGAPVTDWTHYNTAYTERYMGRPQDNPDGYARAALHHHDFPRTPGRLLLVHGAADENVHISHTMSLLRRFVEQGAHYDLLLFPDERHGVRGGGGIAYLHKRILGFLETFL